MALHLLALMQMPSHNLHDIEGHEAAGVHSSRLAWCLEAWLHFVTEALTCSGWSSSESETAMGGSRSARGGVSCRARPLCLLHLRSSLSLPSSLAALRLNGRLLSGPFRAACCARWGGTGRSWAARAPVRCGLLGCHSCRCPVWGDRLGLRGLLWQPHSRLLLCLSPTA